LDLPVTRRSPERPPLSRRPKELTSDPTVMEARGDGHGATILVPRSGAGKRDRRAKGSGATVVTDDPSEVIALEPLAAKVDPRARAAAREIAARLSLRRPPPDSAVHRGAGDLKSLPYRDGLDDIDLDRTLEVMAERPAIE